MNPCLLPWPASTALVYAGAAPPTPCAASHSLHTYTHIYQQGYGSPEVDHTRPTVTAAEVAPDAMSVRLRVEGLVQGHVHDFHLPDFKARDGEPLLHDRAYYTLNEIPKP